MDRRQRLMLLGIAAAIAVAAVVIALVAGGGDDGDDSTTGTTAAQTETTTGSTPDTTTTETTPPEPEVTKTTIELKGGSPDGGVEKVEVKKDERLEIRVASDEDVPIHFHGYDIEKDAGPAKAAVFELEADIEGVFEVEVESTGTQIAEVTVKP